MYADFHSNGKPQPGAAHVQTEWLVWNSWKWRFKSFFRLISTVIPRSPQNGHSKGSCFLFPHALPIPPKFERFDAPAARRTTLRPIERTDEVCAGLWPGMTFWLDAGEGARLRLWKDEVSEQVE